MIYKVYFNSCLFPYFGFLVFFCFIVTVCGFSVFDPLYLCSFITTKRPFCQNRGLVPRGTNHLFCTLGVLFCWPAAFRWCLGPGLIKCYTALLRIWCCRRLEKKLVCLLFLFFLSRLALALL